MELLLLAVSAVSLMLALVMGLSVVRLSRAERTRAAARVAALNAAAAEPEREDMQTLTRVAVPVPDANVAAVVASRAVAPPQSRPAAPWAAAGVPVPSAFRSSGLASSARVAEELPLQSSTSVGDRFLGTAGASESGNRQRGLAIAAVLLFAVVAGGGYWTVFGGRTAAAPAASSATGQSPLELVSLRHDRKGAKLDVTGLIRNPVGGPAVDRLSAVVFLFDQQGGFLSSARADVDYRTLGSGEESPFVISLEAPSTVARYRVSFRTDAGVVPHIDRRGQEPMAANAVNERSTGR